MKLRKISVAVLGAVMLTLAGLTPASGTAPGSESAAGWHAWEVPGGCPGLEASDLDANGKSALGTSAQDCGPVGQIFPQQYAGAGEIVPPCGVWYQLDKYTNITVDQLNGLKEGGLSWSGNQGEDTPYLDGTQWYFVYGGDCGEPEVIKNDGNIKICHATNSDSHPFSNPENQFVNWNSINNIVEVDFNGHGGDQGTHSGDIIPPFKIVRVGDGKPYAITTDPGPDESVLFSYAGKNWTDLGMAIWDNGCEIPVVEVCEYDEADGAQMVEYLLGNEPSKYIPWVDGTECTPVYVQICVWEDGQANQVAVLEEELIGDEVAWVDGTECTPTVDLCVFDGQALQVETLVTHLPDEYILWVDGTECTPVYVDICAEGEGGWYALAILDSELQVTDRLWVGDDGNCEDPQEASLTGSFIGGVCEADAPWIDWDIQLVDPDNMVTPGALPTITFKHPTDSSQDLVYPLDSFSGRMLWPGASVEASGTDPVDPLDPATYAPTGWPGWEFVDDEWVEVTPGNYGWTRDGVEVLIEVNPQATVTVNYPPMTPICAAEPPEEVDVVLGAPPLEDVVPVKATEADAVLAAPNYTG
jgi:hypothetical protein